MRKITVVKGNIITQTDCDGIVNSANRHLIGGSGVCGVIHKAAGPDLEKYTRAFAPLETGEAVISPAFNLGYKYIVHTVGPKYLEDPDPPISLANAIHNSIRLADQNGLTSLAVPAISMGIYGYPAEEGVPILVNTAYTLIDSLLNLFEIKFVVTTDELLNLFNHSIKKIPNP